MGSRPSYGLPSYESVEIQLTKESLLLSLRLQLTSECKQPAQGLFKQQSYHFFKYKYSLPGVANTSLSPKQLAIFRHIVCGPTIFSSLPCWSTGVL